MKNVNYEVEAREILKEIFYENWMTEKDFDVFIAEFFQMTNLNYSKLADQLKTGVENGHSLETQKTILRNLFIK